LQWIYLRRDFPEFSFRIGVQCCRGSGSGTVWSYPVEEQGFSPLPNPSLQLFRALRKGSARAAYGLVNTVYAVTHENW